jgi:hypothetical protein
VGFEIMDEVEADGGRSICVGAILTAVGRVDAVWAVSSVPVGMDAGGVVEGSSEAREFSPAAVSFLGSILSAAAGIDESVGAVDVLVCMAAGEVIATSLETNEFSSTMGSSDSLSEEQMIGLAWTHVMVDLIGRSDTKGASLFLGRSIGSTGDAVGLAAGVDKEDISFDASSMESSFMDDASKIGTHISTDELLLSSSALLSSMLGISWTVCGWKSSSEVVD